MADQTEVPQDIQEDYYQTERREKTGVAWLLALVTLVITVIIATAVFFAGRWIYRKATDNNDNNSTNTSQEEKEHQPAEEATGEHEDSNTETQSNTSQPSQGDGSVQSDATPPASTPTDANLPGTGPASLLSTFLVISMLGYLVHRLYLRESRAHN